LTYAWAGNGSAAPGALFPKVYSLVVVGLGIMSMAQTHAEPSTAPRSKGALTEALLVTLVLVAILGVTHGSTLARLVDRWSHDPQYSHGFIVPLFALAVLWSRRTMLKRVAWRPAWTGLGVLLVGVMARIVAAQYDIEPLDALSLLPTAFGLVLLVGGWSVLRWAWPALAFLAFMMPLPFSLEMALAHPLRRLATVMSAFAMQTVGCPAVAEGNIIFIDDIQLGVAEACSGLGMLMTFFALATALAMIVDAPWHDRLVLVGSAIPIAVLANVIRISATGIAYHVAGRDSAMAKMIYHDLAGWLMMPLALALLWLEMKFLANLFLDESLDSEAPLPLPLPARPAFLAQMPTMPAK
jgi:exosortase